MPILQLQESHFDKLMLLWALCLIKHYQEINRKLCKNNVVADFNESIWLLSNAAWDFAITRKLLDNQLSLTPKGLLAVNNWQRISAKIYEIH